MARRQLTKRQKEVLNSIVRFFNKNERPPSLLDLQDMLDINTPRGVSVHLEALEKKGYIKRDSTARSIRVLEEADEKIKKDHVFLPLLGHIRAGEPNLAEEYIERYVPVSRKLVGPRMDAFLLKVHGNSMNKAHILEGDLVVVQPNVSPLPGDIVVAVSEDESTLKRLEKRKKTFYLKPESTDSRYKRVEVTKGHEIQGKVIGVIRDLKTEKPKSNKF